jgi:phospholipid transport system substrate-binding protein
MRASKISFRSVVILLTFSLMSALALPAAQASADDGAGQFVSSLGARAVSVLSDKEHSTFDQREANFRDILVEGFHIRTISRFVLGRHWRTATDEQKNVYSNVFVDFIVRVYASRFDSYNGEKFEVLKVVEAEGGDSVVRTRILRPSGGAPIGVDYRVRKFDDTYKVVDVTVEGISMLHTHRVEFVSVLNRKGIDGLLSDLQARVDAPTDTNVN